MLSKTRLVDDFKIDTTAEVHVSHEYINKKLRRIGNHFFVIAMHTRDMFKFQAVLEQYVN